MKPWYERDDLPRVISGIVDELKTALSVRVTDIHDAYAMYGSRKGVQVLRRSNPSRRMPINVLRQVIDAYVTKVTKHLPDITYIPVGGGYDQYVQAEMRNSFLRALWSSDKVHVQARLAAYDAAITGIGYLKVYEKDGNVHHERIAPDEVLVDPEDGKYGTPSTYVQVRVMNREVLKGLFPDHAADIDAAQIATTDYGLAYASGVADQVEVYEIWTKGKRHVMVVDDVVLVDEECGEPPFVTLRFLPSLRGYYGESLVTLLEDIQHQVDDLIHMESENVRYHGMSRTWVPAGSRVKAIELSNAPGQILQYDGPTPPTIQAPRLVSDDIYVQVTNYVQQAFAIVGLSEVMAKSEKPAGLASGKALMTYQDIESQRFSLAISAWEDMFVDLAKQDMLVAQEIAKRNPSFSVVHTTKVYGRRMANKYAFRDLGKDDDYILRKFSSSKLPDSLPGRMENAAFLAKLGILNRQEVLRMLDLPDLDRDTTLATIDVQVVDRDIEAIMQGQDVFPDSALDPAAAYDRARRNYLLAVLQGASDDVLDKIETYMKQIPEGHAEVEQMPQLPTVMEADNGQQQ